MAAPQSIASGFWVEKAPGDGSNFVQELNRCFGVVEVDGTDTDEETKVGIGFLRGAVGDSPVVVSISAGAAVAFGEIRGDRRG